MNVTLLVTIQHQQSVTGVTGGGQHMGVCSFASLGTLSVAQMPGWGTEWPCCSIRLFCFPWSSRKTGTAPSVPSDVCALPGLFVGLGVMKCFELSTTPVLLMSPPVKEQDPFQRNGHSVIRAGPARA